jgi:hypothetical protein
MQHIIDEPLDPNADPAALTGPDAAPDRRALIAHHMTALEDLADPASRVDGWTPFARKLFLQLLAETGRVTRACEFAGLSKQSAYSLRARDPVFAAGWDAACELARMPLADALYEQALDGLTETITRDNGSTLTRHKYDSRLSIAVLNRLDRRCDRAADQGSPHLGAVVRWVDFTSAIGQDDLASAQAILAAPVPSGVEGAKLSQASQLPYTPEGPDRDEADTVEHVWWDEDFDGWRTDYPPPGDFEGDQEGEFGDYRYTRSLTPEELELVRLDCAAGQREELAAEEAARDAWFAALRAEHLPDQATEAPVPEPGVKSSRDS